MGSPAIQTFINNGTWTAPAGVTSVTVVSTKAPTDSLLHTNAIASFANMAVLDTYGRIYGWGDNDTGQLGVGDVTPRSSPVAVAGGLQFIQAFNGRNTYLGLASNGVLYSWGFNSEGQLGQGLDPIANDRTSSPVKVAGGLTFTQVAGGYYSFNQFFVGVTSSGAAYSWGNNSLGQLGDGTTVPKSSPVAVVGGLTFSRIIVDGSLANVYGFASDGNLYAWGQTGNALGNGVNAQRSSPTLVIGGQSFYQLSANNGHVLALTADGTAYAWGLNNNGALGTNDRTNRSSPTLVVGGLKFKQILAVSGNDKSSYGLTTSGQLYAWGDNANGQLGDGTVASRSSPVQVLGGLTFQNFTSNGEMVLAITTAGDMYAWGNNTQGQLGDNTVVPKSSPVAVVGGLKFAGGIVSGWTDNVQTSYGYTTTGLLYGWGQNNGGQIGDNTTVRKSSPVLVLGSPSPKLPIQSNSVIIPVTPGTTYTLTMQKPNPTFGSIQIANFSPSQVVLYYQN